jgi:ABC-type Fe3+-hydroxamate transport system substrate-binding protein
MKRTDLMEIREYMEQHYDEPLSVSLLADRAGISPKYFVDLFKKSYGQSAIDFLTDLRINRAKRYILESDYRMREIAQKVGYSDEFYFSRAFKKKVGVPPSGFKPNSIQRIAVSSVAMIGYLLALKLIPVAAPLDPKWTAYYYQRYRLHIKTHLMVNDMQWGEDWEKLVISRPDAIVGTEVLADEVKTRLAFTAPSLFIPIEQLHWKEQLHRTAQFLGREQQGDSWIQDYEHKVKLARQLMVKEVGKDTFIALRIYQKAIHIYCNPGIRDVLYEDLKLNSAITHSDLYNDEVTLAQLGQIDPDRILLLVCPEAESRSYWLSLQHTSAWRKLKAAQRGYVYPIPSDPWFEYSAVSINRMLDEMLLLFTGNSPNSNQDTIHGEL